MTRHSSDIIERIGEDFGTTIVYHQHPNGASVQFFAAVIEAHNDDGPLYSAVGADTSKDHTSDPYLAERFVEGFVKWDGCSHVQLGEINNDGYLHLCGVEDWNRLATTLLAIHKRCGEIMRANGQNVLEDSFDESGHTVS